MNSPEAIVNLFTEAKVSFAKWQKTKEGKRAVGGAELEASLAKGLDLLGGKQASLFGRYGMAFEKGDPLSQKKFSEICQDMENRLVGILRAALSGTKVSVNALDMHRVSQLAQLESVRYMEDLSRRLDFRASKTAPEDALPPMPLLPRRRSYERKSPSPAPQPPIPPKVPQDNEFALIPRPRLAQRTNADALSRPFGRGPSMEALPLNAMEKFQNMSSALIRKVSSSSTLSVSSTSMVESRRSRYEPPESMIPAIEVSYTQKEESSVVIREGREDVQRLWAAANTPLRPNSAPLPQGEWSQFTIRTNELLAIEPSRNLRNRASSSNISLNYSTAELHREEPAFQNLGMERRRGPKLKFSKPPARFNRAVSGP